ncbi:CRAL/TRIO domain-containing protein [Hesseltinella vesiculosa]|uniref:CRAL/TRIO domain-containing protein n=1 Tax=Hesseltinella vesiculosa TaxID=101127 RepID=A0A1X2GQ38_9FUNG|nr:CRAL/TRIO domain-containing protein [Hesseltinella vesiculosa]
MFFEAILPSHSTTPTLPGSELTNLEKDHAILTLRQTIGPQAASLEDDHLRQFLLANAWNLEGAQRQLQNALLWRAQQGADDFPVATKTNKLPLLVSVRGYEYVEDGHVQSDPRLSEAAVRIINHMGGSCFHKFDKEGHPVLIDRTGHHQMKEIGSDITDEELTNFQLACNEFLHRVLLAEATDRTQHSVTRETVIADCSDMGLWQFHMNGLLKVKLVADHFQAHYPETLHRLFIVNAPSAFLVMWKVIKPWLDKRTLDKVHILGKDYRDVLLKYIDEDALPSYLGGNCTCSHLPGGCAPSVHDGSIPMLEKSSHNLVSENPYNPDIMAQAKADPGLRKVAKRTVASK